MRRKTSRPPTLGVGRAGSSKGLGGTFNSQDRETLNQEQDDDRLLVPDAHRRIVFGRRARIVGRRPPPEYKEPEGNSYRLILGRSLLASHGAASEALMPRRPWPGPVSRHRFRS